MAAGERPQSGPIVGLSCPGSPGEAMRAQGFCPPRRMPTVFAGRDGWRWRSGGCLVVRGRSRPMGEAAAAVMIFLGHLRT